MRAPMFDRRGMTLIELLIALTIFGAVIATTLAFMARQNDAFQDSVRRLAALRNLRYALTTLDQDLETLGTNVPEGQPALVHAGDDVIAFSVDYATNVANDPFAVFYDPDAPGGQVRAPNGGFAIPNTVASFPDTAYESAPGVRSPAEVLIFYLEPDTATARADDYVLYRRVNEGAAEIVARNLLRQGSLPFFAYERVADDGTGATALASFADSLVPLHHTASLHGSAADTARSALADSVRGVTVRIAATNGLVGDQEIVLSASRMIPLPNAGLGMLATCGSSPLLGVGITATAGSLPTGEPAVSLTWAPAVDEAGGEGDVVRYVLWRRAAGSPDWGDPYRAIPAGAASYTYEDAAVERGVAYEYGLAAQDCTPTLSGIVSSGAVVVP